MRPIRLLSLLLAVPLVVALAPPAQAATFCVDPDERVCVHVEALCVHLDVTLGPDAGADALSCPTFTRPFGACWEGGAVHRTKNGPFGATLLLCTP